MTSFVPPLFKNFGKAFSDLLKEQFEYKKQFKVKTHTGDVTVETGAESLSKAGDFGGSLKATYKNADIGTFEASLCTSGTTKYSVKADKLTKGLAVKVSGDEKPAGKVEVDYAQEFLSSSVNVEVSKESTAVDGAGVIGFDGLAVGGHVKYDVSGQKLADFNAGAEYAQADFTVTVKTTDQANKVHTSYLHKYSKDLSLGAAFCYDIEASKRLLTFGSSFRVCEHNFTKVKVDTNGVLSAIWEHKLKSPAVKFVLSSELNAKAVSTVPEKFGLALHLGDE